MFQDGPSFDLVDIFQANLIWEIIYEMKLCSVENEVFIFSDKNVVFYTHMTQCVPNDKLHYDRNKF